MLETLIIMLVKIGVVFGALLLTVAYMTWIERKVIATSRYGWVRCGWAPTACCSPSPTA